MRLLQIHRLVALPLVAAMLLAQPTFALAHPEGPRPEAWRASVVVEWNQALLEAVRRTGFRPMWTARALAVVHTAMYDAWAAYQDHAVGVYWTENVRRPRRERSTAQAGRAASMAAYRTLADLFPSQTSALFDPLARAQGLDPLDTSFDLNTPAGVGNRMAAQCLDAAHADGANQLGDLSNGAPYSDYTGYAPVNTPDQLADPNRWQPLRAANGSVQTFLAPHWGLVTPFGMTSGSQFRPGPPPQYPSEDYLREAEAVRQLSAGLTDRQKMMAEYWADGPNTETPPGHWSLFAQFVSARDRHTLNQDIGLFFALGNALLDASIAVWDAKVAYDFVRPVSAIRFVYAGQQIEAWGGPGQGTRIISGERFQSYIATPPFAEYTSGHSAFSAAAAAVLTAFTGSQRFGFSQTFPAGRSTVEPGITPASEVTLQWRTFGDAAIEAGLSRRYGGIHFESGDLASRRLGNRVGQRAWQQAQRYVRGRSPREERD